MALLATAACLQGGGEATIDRPTAGASAAGEAMTRTEGDELARELHATNLVVGIDSAPARLAPGERFVYTVSVVNSGPNPSSSTFMTVTISGPGAWVEHSGGCRLPEDSRLQCELGELLSRARRGLRLTGVARDEAGLIEIIAAVENRFGPDLNPADNVARAETAVTPP